jgi:hypothetical protein
VTQYFPDLLRAVITDVMLILLLCTMAMPKYKSKGVYAFVTAVILFGNIGADYYFYLSGNYTAVFYVDLAMLLIIGIALKPLFSDKIMQWCFSYLTMLNIYVALVFLSYSFSRNFPNPVWGNICLRFLLFSSVVFIFHAWISRLYRKVLDYWHIYILPIAALHVCFLGAFSGDDITDAMMNNRKSLYFLSILGLLIYVAIINSFKIITEHYAMREENQTVQAERAYLQLAAGGMSERLKLMEEVLAQNSRTAHDRRHFNNMLLGLLEKGQTGEAAALLQRQNQAVPNISRIFCENPAVNAVVCHYAGLAERAGILTEIALDIPSHLAVEALELAMVISNLMENAIQACERLRSQKPPYIRFICRTAGRLLLEMENPCAGDTAVDENGLPIAREAGHGIGTRSVVVFAKKYDGELLYKIDDRVFRVRLLV